MYEITDFIDNVVSFGYSLIGRPFVLNVVPYEVIPLNDMGKHMVHDPLNLHFSTQEDLESRLKQIQESNTSYVLRGKTDGYTTYALIASYDEEEVAKVIPEKRYMRYFNNSK